MGLATEKSTLERRTASFADSLPVMNSRLRGASKNMYSGVTIRCFLAASCRSFEPPLTLIGAAEVMGSPCGLVFCSGSTDVIGSPCGLVFTSDSRGLLICSLLYLGVNKRSMRLLSFRRHMHTGRWRGRQLERQRIHVGLSLVHSALEAGIADSLAVGWELDFHLFTHPLEDLGHLPQLGGIHVVDAQHRIFMALLRAKRRGATVRAGADHLQREIGIMAMHADEDARFNLIAPNG